MNCFKNTAYMLPCLCLLINFNCWFVLSRVREKEYILYYCYKCLFTCVHILFSVKKCLILKIWKGFKMLLSLKLLMREKM